MSLKTKNGKKRKIIMRGEVDDVILHVLNNGCRTPEELKLECLRNGEISVSTYHRRLTILINRGKIKKINEYRLVGEKEADPAELYDTIQKLKETDHEITLKTRSEDLKRLVDGKRVAHFRNVLTFLENSINNPKFKAPIVLCNLIISIRRILAYERKRDKPDIRTIKRINRTIIQMKQIIDKQLDGITEDVEDRETFPVYNVLNEVLRFLGETGESEAVSVIFRLVTRVPEKEYKELNRIADSLFSRKYELYKRHHQIINEKLDEMIESSNPTISTRGEELHRKKHNRPAFA